MALNDPVCIDGETVVRGFLNYKRPSSEKDSFDAKRRRLNEDRNHVNQLPSTSENTGHGRMQRTGSFGFNISSSQNTPESSQESEIDDSDDLHSNSLLYAIYRAETLQSGKVIESPPLLKSGSDIPHKGEVFDSVAADPEPPATATSLVGAPSSITNPPQPQATISQANITLVALQRIPSLQRDTETISAILGVGQDSKVTEEVYSKLSALRTHPQRVEVVTNAVLEEQTAAANHEADHETRALMEDVETVLNRLGKGQTTRTVDPNRVFLMLESNKNKSDRVDQVIKTLATENATPATVAPTKRTLMDDVQALAMKFPASDTNELYSLLEAVDPSEDRLQQVTRQLEQKANRVSRTPRKTTTTDKDSANKPQDKSIDDGIHDTFLNDLDLLCKVFPDQDRNEIGALLESCPRQCMRVQEVIRRLVNIEYSQGNQESVPLKTDGPSLDSTEPMEPFDDDSTQEPVVQLKKDVATLQAIVPECDPNFLVEELKRHHDNVDRLRDISAMLLESNNYPKLKDRLEKEKRAVRRQKLFEAAMDIEDFLQTFPEPRQTFYDITSAVSEGYKQHVKVHLCNTFRKVHAYVITQLLEENNYHFTPTLRRLEEIVQQKKGQDEGEQ